MHAQENKSKIPTRPERSGQPAEISRRRKLCFAAVVVLMFLLAVEVVSRFVPDGARGRAGARYAMYDPDLLWRLRPIESGSFATNELGFRDTPFDRNADIRILLLGDSVSWGDGIDDLKKCFPYLLEQRLRAKLSPRNAEVINAGVPGYSTFQQAKYLRRDGILLEPDVICLQFCLNDVVERYHHVAAYGGDALFLGVDTRLGLSGINGFLRRHSDAYNRLARFLQVRSRARETYEVESLAQEELSPQLDEAWQVALEEVDDIRRFAAERRIGLLLIICPYQFQLESPRQRRQPQDRLIQYARSHDVPYVDLLPAFVEAIEYKPLFSDASHFSLNGHYFAALRLVDPVLRALGVQESDATPD